MFANIHRARKSDRNDVKMTSSGLQIEPKGACIEVDWSQPDLALCYPDLEIGWPDLEIGRPYLETN